MLMWLFERFLNKITGAVEAEEPPPFRGGIVADPMGLGKTLTMIALAATDLCTEHAQHERAPSIIGLNDRVHVGATLIVVPPPRKSGLREPVLS